MEKKMREQERERMDQLLRERLDQTYTDLSVPQRSRNYNALITLMISILFAQLVLFLIIGFTTFYYIHFVRNNWGQNNYSRPNKGGVLMGDSLVIQGKNGGLIWIGERRGQMCIDLKDSNGRSKALLSLNTDGEPMLSLFDRDQRPMILSSSMLKGKLVDNDSGKKIIFIGSKTSNKYHYIDCKWIKFIKNHNKIYFDSIESAKKSGYNPCPTCRPPGYGSQ